MKKIKDLWDKIWNIYLKHKEIINYLIFGALGTLVSIASYEICRLLGLEIVVSNIISWIITVLFVYVTNKIFVFKSKSESKGQLIKELISFIVARIVTLIIETLILYFGTYILKINDLIVKIVAQIIIIILNYIFSKLIIFKKDKKINC